MKPIALCRPAGWMCFFGRRMIARCCVFGCVAVFAEWGTAAATTVLHPVADTTLFEPSPRNNLGGIDTLAAGATASGPLTRALLKFDPAFEIPARAQITQVRLRVQVVKTPTSGGKPSLFELRTVLKPWGEGRGAGNAQGKPAADGEATWMDRFAGQGPWAQPGGEFGVDFSSAQSAAASIAGVGEVVFESTPKLVADVQAWIDEPSTNFGWVLASQSESNPETARRFASRESAGGGPALEIEYEAAPAPRIDRIEVVNREARIHFMVMPGQTYQVEAASSLGAAWELVEEVQPMPVGTNVVVIESAGFTSRFYRLRLPPASER